MIEKFFLGLLVLIIGLTAAAQKSLHSIGQLVKPTPATQVKFIEDISFNPETSAITVVATNIKNETEAIVWTPKIDQVIIANTIERCAGIQFKYALLMNREVELYSNIPLYHFIDEWWATRYHYGGADKSGIDCSAFTGKLMSAIYGFTLARTSPEQYNLSQKIATENLKEGDLVFFKNYGAVNHVGVYLGDNYFVHSSVHAGVTISNLTDAYYSRKFIGGGRAH